MATLDIQAPDGKTLSIDIPEGTDPSQYDSIVDDVMKDYSKSARETPGVLKSGALGLMSGIPGVETAISAGEAALTPKTYEEAHRGWEEAKDKAWEAHPVAYGTGKTAGLVGTAVAAPASIPGAVAVGALSGLDVADKPSEMIADAMKGGATGAALGYVGEKVVSPLISKIPGLAKSGVASLGAKTTKEDVEAYLRNPEAIRNALTKSQLGEKVADIGQDIGKAAGQMSSEARSMLNPENVPLNVKTLRDAAADTMGKYFTNGRLATAADEAASKAINDQYKRLAQIASANNGEIPENLLRDMIDRMQSATKESTFGNPEASAAQAALRDFSGKLNDILRTSNKEYAAEMAPSAELAKLSSDVKTQFGLKPTEVGELAPTDVTATKLGNALKEGKPQGADLMERIRTATGTDLRKMLEEAQIKENFATPGAGGGLHAMLPALGYGIGRMTGVPFGGIIGAGIGHFSAGSVDGAMIAKNILDMYIKGSRAYNATAVAPLVSKFGPILAAAAKQGGNQLAATHFVLATSNPEYQDLMEHAQQKTEGQ